MTVSQKSRFIENLELLQLFQPVISKIAHQSKLQNFFVIGQNTRAHLPEVTQILIQLAHAEVALAAWCTPAEWVFCLWVFHIRSKL